MRASPLYPMDKGTHCIECYRNKATTHIEIGGFVHRLCEACLNRLIQVTQSEQERRQVTET